MPIVDRTRLNGITHEPVHRAHSLHSSCRAQANSQVCTNGFKSMSQKMCVVTLCLVLFVSQVTMVSVNRESSDEMSEPSPSDTKASSRVNPSEEEKFRSSEVIPTGQFDQMKPDRLDRYESESPLMMMQVLSRIRRALIQDHKCAVGFVRLWGKCITCKE